ncbi:hypothetical protein BC826DRAFT_1002025 [Russula brevipes]|nr:hypothetical protein BC826DRAFT_1002025 [Russula brevipes]
MSGSYIVVFKRTASDKDIDDQAEEVKRNGGLVKNRFNPKILRGFSAVIPDTYLLVLQSNIQQAQIDYIGKADAI